MSTMKEETAAMLRRLDERGDVCPNLALEWLMICEDEDEELTASIMPILSKWLEAGRSRYPMIERSKETM